MIATGVIAGLVILVIVTKAAKEIADMKDEARLVKMKRKTDKKRWKQKRKSTAA
ncbi:MAG: hypothetical protein ACPIG6_06220 [Akkermansiaceae bacterium]